MKKFLIVVDMQKDFVDGSLGTNEAVAMIPNAVKKIEAFEGTIIATYDTHTEEYLNTAEGKKLPVVHCVENTPGWQLNSRIQQALDKKHFIAVKKSGFGSLELHRIIEKEVNGEAFSLELIGLCTDICVVTNALILKTFFPDAPIAVDANCCAGVTPALHDAALMTMASCQIDVERNE